MTATQRIALIGAGAMGSLHARVISQHPAAELACVIDVNLAAAAALAERHGGAAAAAFEPAGIDAVIVATPTEHHGTWARQALAAGVPLLIEKPIAHDVAEVVALLDEAAARDLPITCGFIERWNPAVMLAQEILAEPLYFQAFRHSPYVARIPGGVAGDLLIHDVDLALRLFGTDPTAVRGERGFFHPQSAPGAEDVAEAQLSFGTRLATASASRIAQQKLRQVRIYDLQRMIDVDLLRQDVTVLRHVGNEFEESGAYRQQTVIDIPVVPNRREPLLAQLDHFLALARGDRDHAAERATLLAPHQVIAAVCRE